MQSEPELSHGKYTIYVLSISIESLPNQVTQNCNASFGWTSVFKEIMPSKRASQTVSIREQILHSIRIRTCCALQLVIRG